MADVLHQLEDLYHLQHNLGGDTAQAEAERVLTGLGFWSQDLESHWLIFPGGWKMRVELVKCCCASPIFWCSMNPNHLDMDAIILAWILYDDLRTTIWRFRTIRQFSITCPDVNRNQMQRPWLCASYPSILFWKEERFLMENAFLISKSSLLLKERTIDRFPGKGIESPYGQSMIKQLDKIERIEWSPTDLANMVVKFPPAPRSGEIAITTVYL